MAGECLPLTALPVGTTARISAVNLGPDERGRLLELGLVCGTSVELVRYAPLGDPVEICVRGSHLTLRRHEADQILVSSS
jgi:Fe2+ transport system protein FeoA